MLSALPPALAMTSVDSIAFNHAPDDNEDHCFMRILLRVLSALTIGAFLFATTEVATAAGTSSLVTSFTPDQVTQVVTALGGSDFETKTTDSGLKILHFKAYDLHYTLVFKVCKPDCLGLLMLINFSTEGVKVTTDMLNEFNTRFDYAAASLEKDQAILTRYVIADGGITTDNISANISNFFYAPKVLIDFIKSKQTVAYMPPASQSQTAYGYQGGASGGRAPETHFELPAGVPLLPGNSLLRMMR
jgi:hypothetical protein